MLAVRAEGISVFTRPLSDWEDGQDPDRRRSIGSQSQVTSRKHRAVNLRITRSNNRNKPVEQHRARQCRIFPLLSWQRRHQNLC